jgi:hypothetical protein
MPYSSEVQQRLETKLLTQPLERLERPGIRDLGWFQDGNFRDQRGSVIGWVVGASGGPVKPAAAAVPAMPTMAARPAMPAQPATPAVPVASLSWSAMTWQQFVDQ